MAPKTASKTITKTAPKTAPKTKAVTNPPPEVEEPKATPVVTTEEEINYSMVIDNLSAIDKLIKATVPLVRKLQKKHDKDVKVASKQKKQKRVRDPSLPPSGFARPGPVSEELRTFLDLGKDDLIARTQVAKKMSEYIKENNLKNPDNNKEIVLDKKLAKLFGVTEKTKVEFFKIQGFLTKHFIKA